MTTYKHKRTKVNYRKIYEDNFGPIPVDPNGRRYEVHHIDGNSHNNDPSNLKAVSIQEHYDIHLSQGDYFAAFVLATRMELYPEKLSEVASLNAKKQVEENTHNFQTRPDGTNLQTDKVAAGTHPWLTRPDGTSHSSDMVAAGKCALSKRPDGTSVTSDRVANGTYHMSRREDGTSIASDKVANGTCPLSRRPDGTSVASDRVANGNHNFQTRPDGTSLSSDRVVAGTHNFLKDKGTVTCYDVYGKFIRIPKDQYHSQSGPMEDWEWVSTNSKIGKIRKKINQK